MEMTTIVGLLIGLGGIVLGNIIEGGHISSLVQGAAAIIVFGGTLGAVVVSSRMSDLRLAWDLFKKAFERDSLNEEKKVVSEILDCARLARRESILAIEPRIAGMKNEFLQEVIRSVVDGVDPVVIRSIFEKQIEIIEHKLNGGAKVWTDAGGFSPTIGIIGAVLGLIHVMGNLTDTSKLGSGIAVAFVATIYGVASANLLFLPISNRIKKIISSEVLIHEMILEGGLSILSGLSPAVIESKLMSFTEKGPM